MGFFRKGRMIARQHFMHWKRDYRVWFVFLMETFLILRYLSGITLFGWENHLSVTPFLLPVLFTDYTAANGLLKIQVYFGLVVLLCNAPFRDESSHYLELRCGRRAWWFGSCIYIVVTSLFYILFLSAVSALASLPVLTLKPYWGSALVQLLDADLSMQGHYLGQLVLPADIIRMVYPFTAWLLTAVTAWLSFCFLGALIYAVNTATGILIAGSFSAAFFVLLDPVIRWFGWSRNRFWWYYLSPVSYSSIEHWDFQGMFYPLHGSYCLAVLGGLILILLMFACGAEYRQEIRLETE